MHTTSEIAVTAAIWGLTAIGMFFGTRAALRKKRLKRAKAVSTAQQPKRDAVGSSSDNID